MFNSSKLEKIDDIKAVLEALTINVESINKFLSGEQGGKSSPLDLKNIAKWLQYMNNSLNKISNSQEEVKTLLISFNSQINEGFRNSVEYMVQNIGKGGGSSYGPPEILQENFAPKIILDMQQKLNDLGVAHAKEIELVMRQNQDLKERLVSLENQIRQLSDSLNKPSSKY